ncbi:MAG: hypothetical protein GY867_06540 [bacterium]|nr:hypothetical protein [bacterium]
MKEILGKIGQLFVMGFQGERPSKHFLNFVDEEQIGGFILFEENCRTYLMARENLELLRSHCRSFVPFMAVDQEGGRVCRLKGAPAEFRSPSEYARDNAVERFVEDYSRSMVLLDSLGFNLNLAPVADIGLDNNNGCLLGRTLGDTPEQVAEFVRAAVGVTKRQGMLSCLKHFPGLGAAAVDPHESTSSADYDELIWRQREKIPFAEGIDEGADLVMTTHLRLPKIDDKMVSHSEKIISELLREELHFDGPVITDDLTMKGAAEVGDIGERAVAAFNAGHDLLLFGANYEETVRAFDYFVDAVRRGEVQSGRLSSALDRIAGLKYKLEHSMAR